MAALCAALLLAPAALARAQTAADSAFFKALELETQGKFKDAIPLYRASLKSSNAVSAFLGLERAMHEAGWVDSLFAPIAEMIEFNREEPVYRVAQLRAYQTLGREAELRRSFERWVADKPGDAQPYREYAKLLLGRNQRSAADSVVTLARTNLGSVRGLEMEVGQLRAASGDWLESAIAWRTAVKASPYLDQAAAYALGPTPNDKRDSIRTVFLAPPIEVGARRALSSLEAIWGSTVAGWTALKDLPADTAAAEAWSEFARRAEAEERWTIARDALVAAYRVQRDPDVAVRAATASLNAGDPGSVMALAPLSQANGDSARMARFYVPLHARALAMMGRPADAERLVTVFEKWIAPGPRSSLTRTIALGWVRHGDVAQARAALAAAGPEADSSDTAGWLALYDGDLRTARAFLRAGTEATPELALALGTIARIKADRSEEVGKAFLALARGDSVGAATQFLSAAERVAEANSLLVSIAAQLRASIGDEPGAVALWKHIVETMSESPEAPQADLEWARSLRKRGDSPGAIARLEHMIVTYPRSALVPQARRELEALKRVAGEPR